MPIWPFTAAERRRRALAALPPCALPATLDLSAMQRVLVFAPHPDDETLGCGGTLARLAGQCAIKVVLVTDGSGAGGLPAGSDRVRQNEFAAALARLGIKDHCCLQQPDGHFVANARLADEVRRLLADFQPDHIFLPSPVDYHRDHLRIADFLVPLCQQVPSLKALLHYEIWAPLPASHIVDITEQWPLKAAALAEHRTAMACGDYLRAIEGLNRYRGLYLGRERFAESFLLTPARRPGLFTPLLDACLRLIAGDKP